MAKQAKSVNKVVASSGDVFADLGLPDAAELDTKVRLAVAVNRLLESRRLTQAAAATALSINQPKISALKHYKLEGFSVERLMTFLTALGSDIVVVGAGGSLPLPPPAPPPQAPRANETAVRIVTRTRSTPWQNAYGPAVRTPCRSNPWPRRWLSSRSECRTSSLKKSSRSASVHDARPSKTQPLVHLFAV
jgi:predicted XRE-type DNA-binding protein